MASRGNTAVLPLPLSSLKPLFLKDCVAPTMAHSYTYCPSSVTLLPGGHRSTPLLGHSSVFIFSETYLASHTSISPFLPCLRVHISLYQSRNAVIMLHNKQSPWEFERNAPIVSGI